jgi:hypothetical protein
MVREVGDAAQQRSASRAGGFDQQNDLGDQATLV